MAKILFSLFSKFASYQLEAMPDFIVSCLSADWSRGISAAAIDSFFILEIVCMVTQI
jgi:hypothetical protein